MKCTVCSCGITDSKGIAGEVVKATEKCFFFFLKIAQPVSINNGATLNIICVSVSVENNRLRNTLSHLMKPQKQLSMEVGPGYFFSLFLLASFQRMDILDLLFLSYRVFADWTGSKLEIQTEHTFMRFMTHIPSHSYTVHIYIHTVQWQRSRENNSDFTVKGLPRWYDDV